MKINWDIMGIATSVACAIHCALLPVLLAAFPVLGLTISHNGIFEWGMISLAFVIGTYALYHGYHKHHQNPLPGLMFGAGFVLLVLKQFFHSAEYFLLALAVILIIAAHYYNFRLCHQSKCSSPHHKH